MVRTVKTGTEAKTTGAGTATSTERKAEMAEEVNNSSSANANGIGNNVDDCGGTVQNAGNRNGFRGYFCEGAHNSDDCWHCSYLSSRDGPFTADVKTGFLASIGSGSDPPAQLYNHDEEYWVNDRGFSKYDPRSYRA